MSASSPTATPNPIDSMSNDALLSHLTPPQQRDLETEFYHCLRDMNFIGEIQDAKGDKLERMAYVGAFALETLKRCTESFIERLRADNMIELPQENPESSIRREALGRPDEFEMR